MLVQPAQRTYRTWIVDSRRWEHYRPRAGDIVVATYPKCGTTWTQQIVSLLIFQSPEPRPVLNISPWIERRFPEPIETVIARIEAQEHRRFLKTHLAADGLPIYDEVRYIHVARSGLDACMSFHNHCTSFTADALAALDKAGLEDETIARPYPRPAADPADFFRAWIGEGAVPGHDDGRPIMSFFTCERTFWELRRRPNFLFVHYNDLKVDLAGEMRRIADFLAIEVPAKLWRELVAAAQFEAMRSTGDVLLGKTAGMFEGGGARFFHAGTNDRWRGVLNEADLALYEAKVKAKLTPDCAQWVANGRLGAGDPRAAA